MDPPAGAEAEVRYAPELNARKVLRTLSGGPTRLGRKPINHYYFNIILEVRERVSVLAET
jgi:hypothetical protein